MVCNGKLESLIEQPTNDVFEIIKRDIGEDESRLEHNEKLLQNWIQCQPHFPKNIDKILIKNFIRLSKHDMEKAKKKLEQHLIVKNNFRDLYEDRNPYCKDLANAIDIMNIVFLPKLTDNGERVGIFSVDSDDIDKFDAHSMVKIILMIVDIHMYFDVPVGGEIAILDGKNFTANHYVKLISPIFKTFIMLCREAYPIRLRQVHLLNVPPLGEKAVAAIKPFLHEKVKDRIQLHKTLESLHKYVSPKILPPQYGGEGKSMKKLKENWTEILRENKDWFKERESVKITQPMSQKYDRNSNFNAHLGIEGSFRKLEID